MARDHARIRLSLAADEDYRSLTSSAQWLYKHLLISSTLNFIGVADWRPARIAAQTAELTGADVESFGETLQDAEFVLVDGDSEEVLIRSFVKHDELMKSPNMAKALAKDYDRVSSAILRAVAIDQLIRLRENQPDLKGWNAIGSLLEKPSMTFAEGFRILYGNPSANPSANPLGKGSVTPFLPSSLTPGSTKSNRTYGSGDLDGGLDLESHA